MNNKFKQTQKGCSINGRFTGIILPLVFLLLAGIQPCKSQQKSITDSTYTINEVVVTERSKPVEVAKISVPLKYTPINISSVSVKGLEIQGVDNVNDALRNATGIKPVVTYGGFQTFYMRGFGSPVMMVDGQRDERMNYSSSAPLPDLTSIESLELLKGPASVLYGHSAVGGILNIVRKAPMQESHANAQISYGTWNSKRATLGANGKIAQGISFRADVGTGSRDGWRNNGDERFSSYLAFGFDISPKDKLELRLGYVDDFYGTEAGIPTVGFDVLNAKGDLVLKKNSVPSFISRAQRYNDPADFLKNKDYNGTLKYCHRFNDNLKLVESFSYFNNDINYFSTETLKYLTSASPVYNTYYEDNGKRTYICLDTLQRTSPLRFSHMTQTLQNQLELEWKVLTGSVDHSILAGWSVMSLDRTSYTGYNNGVDVYGPGYLAKVATVNPVLNQGAVLTKFSKANPRKDLTNGIYFQDVIGISSKLKLMLGGRFDFFKFETAGSVATIDGKRSYTHNTLDWDKSKSVSFTYRAGAVYLPVENLSLYGSFATFFKPYRDVYNSTYIYIDKNGNEFTPNKGEEIFKPETGYQAEFGVRYELPRILRVNASAFYIHKENIRENLGNVTVQEEGKDVTKKVMAQVGVVNSKGFDAEVVLTPVQNLMVSGGYTFTVAEYGDFRSNPYVDGDTRKGNQQVYTPKHLSFANLSYIFNMEGQRNVVVGMGVTASSKSYTNATNSIYLPSYAVVNAFASYTFVRGIKIGVAARNIFDRTYYEWALGNSQFIPSEEINFQVSLSYSF